MKANANNAIRTAALLAGEPNKDIARNRRSENAALIQILESLKASRVSNDPDEIRDNLSEAECALEDLHDRIEQITDAVETAMSEQEIRALDFEIAEINAKLASPKRCEDCLGIKCVCPAADRIIVNVTEHQRLNPGPNDTPLSPPGFYVHNLITKTYRGPFQTRNLAADDIAES